MSIKSFLTKLFYNEIIVEIPEEKNLPITTPNRMPKATSIKANISNKSVPEKRYERIKHTLPSGYNPNINSERVIVNMMDDYIDNSMDDSFMLNIPSKTFEEAPLEIIDIKINSMDFIIQNSINIQNNIDTFIKQDINTFNIEDAKPSYQPSYQPTEQPSYQPIEQPSYEPISYEPTNNFSFGNDD